MAIPLQLSIFRSSPPSSSSQPLQRLTPAAAVAINNAQTRERLKLKDLFREARERCVRDPMDGVEFTLDEFHRALDDRDFGIEVGCKVKGTVLTTNSDGAFVDISGKSSAFLPLEESCIYKIKHVSEAGIYPGLQQEFVVIGENVVDDSVILSLRLIQCDFAWERCQQLQAEDVIIKSKVVGENKGGILVVVEGLHGFVPFSEIPKAAALAFYILSALFFNSFVIIFVVTVFLAALDFWVVKNVSGRILVGLRWWNEINEQGESVWKFECLDQESLARMNKKDTWLFWWTIYLSAVAWIFLGIFSLIRFQADYLLVVGVCLTLSLANIIGFTKCRKDAKKQIQQFASETIASRFSSTLQSAFSVV
ncbi:uncharacterized protein A4U43_C08F32090 [Asparagus officinalis]|nr:uncharacterized protein A4U43_C08F32090 [Asparagus officinalis]